MLVSALCYIYVSWLTTQINKVRNIPLVCLNIKIGMSLSDTYSLSGDYRCRAYIFPVAKNVPIAVSAHAQ